MLSNERQDFRQLLAGALENIRRSDKAEGIALPTDQAPGKGLNGL